MSTRFTTIAFGLSLVSLAACSERHLSSEPPPPELHTLGIITATVSGKSITTQYTPAPTPGYKVNPLLSPAIYAGEDTLVHIFGVVDSIHGVVGDSNVWFIRIGARNLLTWPIGAIQGAAIPSDTMGVFLVITGNPVVTNPVPFFCAVDCHVTILNFMGTGSFGSPGQPYFWYHNRPTAMQAVPGTDQTDSILWQFATTNVTPPESVTAFTFQLMVSAAWPPGHDTLWTVQYDGTADSIPDTQASPLWKVFKPTAITTLGSEAFTSGSHLELTDASAASNIYFSRDDSIDSNSSTYVDAKLAASTCPTNVICAVFGVAQPDAGGQLIFAGVAHDSVGFVTWDQTTATWTMIPGAVFSAGPFDGTATHTYRIRVIPPFAANLCIDKTNKVPLAIGSFTLTAGTDFVGRTYAWGDVGQAGGTVSDWQLMRYQINNDGGNCG